MKYRISPATVIASVALFFAVTGVGIATTGYRITSLWQIAPHVRHALRGHTGTTGPQGIQGPAGPQGAGFDWTGSQNFVSDTVALTPDAPKTVVQVNCPTGFIALTGGYVGYNEVVTISNDTSNPPARGWVIWAHLESGASDGEVQAWAECVRLNS